MKRTLAHLLVVVGLVCLAGGIYSSYHVYRQGFHHRDQYVQQVAAAYHQWFPTKARIIVLGPVQGRDIDDAFQQATLIAKGSNGKVDQTQKLLYWGYHLNQQFPAFIRRGEVNIPEFDFYTSPLPHLDSHVAFRLEYWAFMLGLILMVCAGVAGLVAFVGAEELYRHSSKTTRSESSPAVSPA